MSIRVLTDHQIMPFGDDTMALFEVQTGQQIVSAARENGAWTIHAHVGDIPDDTAATRAEALTAMTEHALAALGGNGYSTLIPTGLADLP